MLAAEQSQETTVRQLLDWNAKVDLRDRHRDDALMGAASAFCFFPEARRAQANIMKLLIAHGADPNGRDDTGLTPLMAVTTYGNTAAARVLIDAGARLDSKDNDGRSPLDHARSALEKYHEHDWAKELRQLVKLLEELGNPTHISSPTPD
jgi:ankyrin repeat protein